MREGWRSLAPIPLRLILGFGFLPITDIRNCSARAVTRDLPALWREAGFDFMNITGQTETGAPIFGMSGHEVNLLCIAGFLALMLGGAGAMSIDAARRSARREQRVPGGLPVEPTEHEVPDRAWTGEREETSETVGSPR